MWDNTESNSVSIFAKIKQKTWVKLIYNTQTSTYIHCSYTTQQLFFVFCFSNQQWQIGTLSISHFRPFSNQCWGFFIGFKWSKTIRGSSKSWRYLQRQNKWCTNKNNLVLVCWRYQVSLFFVWNRIFVLFSKFNITQHTKILNIIQTIAYLMKTTII